MSTLLDLPIGACDAEWAEIIDALTRRGFLAGTGGAALGLGLAACGSSHPASTAGPATRVIDTIHGRLRVPADPRRIVALDFPEACALLDLGITPVGQPSYMPAFAPYTTALRGVPVATDAEGKPILEKVAAVRPDLIVSDDWARPAQQVMPYGQLRLIAPTTIFGWQQAAGNWRDLAAETAGAVGRTAAMTALEHTFLNRAAQINSTYLDLLARTRWDLIDCSQDSWDLYGQASSHGRVLTDARVQLGAARTQAAGYVQYSFEDFDLLGRTDVIVTTPASMPYLRKQAAFASLPAVRAGRLFTTSLFFPASYGVATALLGDLASFCRKLQAGTS